MSLVLPKSFHVGPGEEESGVDVIGLSLSGLQVLIDGMDVKNLNLKYLRSQIGLVGQEPVMFT